MSLTLISHDKFLNQEDWGRSMRETRVMDFKAKGVPCSSFVARLQHPWHPPGDAMYVMTQFKNSASLQQRWWVVIQENLFSTCWSYLHFTFSTNVWVDLQCTILHQKRGELTMNCCWLAAWRFRHKFCLHFLRSATATQCSSLSEILETSMGHTTFA